MENSLTRRSFVKWSTIVAGGAAAVGFVGCKSQSEDGSQGEATEGPGEWRSAACMHNCTCESSRCLLKVYLEDGVPLLIESDFEDEDTIEVPQRRACLRGYSQISNMLSPARIKYPMKRKGWSPENPNGEMRGKDEWERISWEEALDIVSTQIKRIIDEYGVESIFVGSQVYPTMAYFDPIMHLFHALGGSLQANMGTISVGAWISPSVYMTGNYAVAPDTLTLMDCELQLLFGCNWVANKGGNITHQLQYAKENGTKIIIVDPWMNQTAQIAADEWIPIKPGTDTAFMIGIMYHQIQNNLFDQEYLDKYCSGFDAEHMPEGAPVEDNFKDYVLGTYDGEPKTPEWAEKICGVPAAKTRELAEEIFACKKVNFFCGQSVSKIPAGTMVPQAFYTLALMHGGIGAPGNYMSWIGHGEHGWSATRYVSPGDAVNPFGTNTTNQLSPPKIMITVDYSQIEDNDSWAELEVSECWQSILDGEYGRDSWPDGKRKVDVHMIYTGGYANYLNSYPNANAGIKAFRKVDFVFAAHPFFCASAQYADIIVPVATWWEKSNFAWSSNSETVYWSDRIMEPIYEAKPETVISEELAKLLDIDPKVVNTATDEERTYASIRDFVYLTDSTTMEYLPALTITQEDIDELGVEGEPQEGAISFKEFKEKGLFKAQRSFNDNLGIIPFKSFYDDPEGSPLYTASGKFEIYCPTLEYMVNTIGFSKIYPIAKWQSNPKQGEGSQTEEFPLLLWTPHTLRRAHTVFDNVISLREAFPQECFISTVDAEARGIENGDIVLMSSPHGKVLRPAKVLPTVVPGAVALQDGAWLQIDEETGIDLAGNPNILQAPEATGEAIQAWTGTIVQVEKYTGDLELLPDKHRPIPSLDSVG